jgi:hypothetical protein
MQVEEACVKYGQRYGWGVLGSGVHGTQVPSGGSSQPARHSALTSRCRECARTVAARGWGPTPPQAGGSGSLTR